MSKINDLQEPYKSMALYEQDFQNCPMDLNIPLRFSFIFDRSIAGPDFWSNVVNEGESEITKKL